MKIADLIARVLREAMPRGDLTSRHLKLEDTLGGAKLVAEEDLVLAGREALEISVGCFAPRAECKWHFEEGQAVLAGQNICWLRAPSNALLTVQPIALELLGRACGIATAAHAFAEQTKDTATRVVFSRGLDGNWLEFDEAAARAGGAKGMTGDLSSTLFVSRDHARAAGSLREALTRVGRGWLGEISVECDSIEEVRTAVEARVARVILTRRVDPVDARRIVPRRIVLEAAEEPSPAQVRRLARADVDAVILPPPASFAPPKRISLTLAAP